MCDPFLVSSSHTVTIELNRGAPIVNTRKASNSHKTMVCERGPRLGAPGWWCPVVIKARFPAPKRTATNAGWAIHRLPVHRLPAPMLVWRIPQTLSRKSLDTYVPCHAPAPRCGIQGRICEDDAAPAPGLSDCALREVAFLSQTQLLGPWGSTCWRPQGVSGVHSWYSCAARRPQRNLRLGGHGPKVRSNQIRLYFIEIMVIIGTYLTKSCIKIGIVYIIEPNTLYFIHTFWL